MTVRARDAAVSDDIASAREILTDLVIEGVDAFAALPEAPPVSPPPLSPPPLSPPPVSPPPTSPPIARQAPADDRTEPGLALWSQSASELTLEEVRETLGDCRRCGLCEGRNTIVFGDGDPHADLMFIGEGPGEQEDRRGLPFVGRAGELLTQMIEKGLEIPRSSTYICNIVKCRPPKNRNPLPDEVRACSPFLDGQIDAVRPKVIVTLGKPAASLLLGRDVAITRVRGTWREYRGIPVMPTFHPAYLLRQYTPENRRAVWEDLKAALARTRES